jgi:hypothetical protein
MKAELSVNRALIVILAVILSSCTSLKIPDKAKNDFVEVFDGQSDALLGYELVDNQKDILNFLFKPSKADSILRRENEKLFIDIFKSDKNTVEINLRNQYGDTSSRKFRGEFDETAFRFTTKLFMTGNPLIWGLGTYENVLAKNSIGELILYHHRGGIAFVTLLPIGGSSTGLHSNKFRKLN